MKTFNVPNFVNTTLQDLKKQINPNILIVGDFITTSNLLDRSFVFLHICFLSCLYILDVNDLSDVSLVKVSSHSVGFFFTSLIVSFIVQKLLSLMK